MGRVCACTGPVCGGGSAEAATAQRPRGHEGRDPRLRAAAAPAAHGVRLPRRRRVRLHGRRHRRHHTVHARPTRPTCPVPAPGACCSMLCMRGGVAVNMSQMCVACTLLGTRVTSQEHFLWRPSPKCMWCAPITKVHVVSVTYPQKHHYPRFAGAAASRPAGSSPAHQRLCGLAEQADGAGGRIEARAF